MAYVVASSSAGPVPHDVVVPSSSSPTPTIPHSSTEPQPSEQAAASTNPPPTNVTSNGYIEKHNLHWLLDRMVRDILQEKPNDPDNWMIRWCLEQHRAACEKKHLLHSSAGSVVVAEQRNHELQMQLMDEDDEVRCASEEGARSTPVE